MKEECLATAKVVSIYAKKFGKGQWSFIGPGSEIEVVFYGREQPTRNLWDHIAEKMLVEFADVQFSVQRLHCPWVNSKAKDTENCQFTITADQETIETIFRIIVSANQLSLYGAVANMCEECESLHDRSGQPDKVMGQSIVLSEIKTEAPLENDDPAYRKLSIAAI